jgi:hypothetical protein
MRKILLVVVLVVVIVGTVAAETVNCTPPCPTCPPVQVTCECTQTELPGLWVMNINGVEWCGKVTVIGPGMLLERSDGERTYGYINKIKKFHMIESCE